MRDELWLMKEELKQLNTEKERLKASSSGWCSDNAGQVTKGRVSGQLLYQGIS